jgi:transposase-like protein
MDRQVANENKNKSDDRDERWAAYRAGYRFFKDTCNLSAKESYGQWPKELDDMTESVLSEWIRGWKEACRTFFSLENWDH